jgi:hypothetical protein
MEISDEQKEAVAGWVQEGASLADVQKRLLEEFALSMTYMDVRFLVDDLELSLKDRAEPPSRDLTAVPSPSPDEVPNSNDVGPGGVQIELDRVLKPGSIVSGTVIFSDGMSAAWSVDQVGRLSLDPKTKGYRPDADDFQEFQVQLQRALQGNG